MLDRTGKVVAMSRGQVDEQVPDARDRRGAGDRVMRRLAVLAAALLALAPAGALAAQPRASFNDIEDEVMCDTCNVPLNIAESARADQERAQIRGYIAQGLTKQQIKDRLKAQWGPGNPGHPRRAAASAPSSGSCPCCRAGGHRRAVLLPLRVAARPAAHRYGAGRGRPADLRRRRPAPRRGSARYDR